ncbi:MAG TPA: hypothetical protein PLD20_19890 [Blastocatellia bacterium]|nr:hypothetical protein [Blastocatellia bacterium]HMX24613.1 hypothetical protein [Blastocatellia bacterium]HMY73818.1 hypothetical protein [Blastocatellia bacterium]HMZ20211.1 hypothetical protein [Blastocatellia bacterium]HNG33355.1 hypothetical protein [Blastocatellia bacterium]
MILNTSIFKPTVETAKAKCAGKSILLCPLDHAVVEIERAKYWSLTDTVLTIISTTSGKRYVISDDHSCEAHNKHCKYLVAHHLMQRDFEALVATDAVPRVVTKNDEPTQVAQSAKSVAVETVKLERRLEFGRGGVKIGVFASPRS